MTWSFWHPKADLLEGFASRSLVSPEQRTVARHLESCVRCRETVAALRSVEEVARDAEPGEAVLERIIASRAAGRRGVLPTADMKVAAPRRPVALVGGLAAAAVLLALVLIRGSREASAGERTGYLRLDPARPLPGALIRVTYTPSTGLQGFDSLVLRARFRRPQDDSYNRGPMQQRATVLHRRSSGVFGGEFRLPDSVVFAVFAVESPSGAIVDDNDERLWELVTADSAHRPLFEALVQKQRDLMGRNWEEGLKTARTLAALYADEPVAWSRLSTYERWVLGDRIADSLLSGHRRRFAAFQRNLAERRSLPVATVSGMLSYAITVDDSASGGHWLSRLEQEFPDDPEVLFRRENRLGRDHLGDSKDPAAYFTGLEPIWRKLASVRSPEVRLVAQNAVARAFQTRDTVGLRVWTSRFREIMGLAPEWDAYWAAEVLKYPTLRGVGMKWLREDAHQLAAGADAYRPLNVSTVEQQAANRAAAQPMLTELAKALLQDGDTAAGLDTLRLAASYGWDPRVLFRVAETWKALGDTLQALKAYAMVAADPSSGPQLGDSVRAAIAPHVPDAQWKTWIAEGRATMRSVVLTGATPRALTGPTRLLSSAGHAVRLNDLTNGHVTVVAFWSPGCFFSVRDLGALQRLAERFETSGARVVAIVDRPFSEDLRRILKEQDAEHLTVFYDYRSDTKRAFVNFTSPDYFVLDATGRVIFSHSALEALPRQITALLP